MDDLLRDLLGAFVADVDGAPPNFSVSVRDQPAGARTPRPVHTLHRGSRTVARSRDPGRIVRALLRHLDAVAHPPGAGLLVVRAVPLVAGDRAVLAPAKMGTDLAAVQPHLRRAGLRLADVPHATVDPERGELVVPDVRLDLRPSGLRRLEELDRSADDDPPVPPGRYPLVAWAFAAGEPIGEMPARRGRLWAYPTVVDAPGVETTLSLLDRVLEHTAAVSVPSGVPAQVRHLAGFARPS